MRMRCALMIVAILMLVLSEPVLGQAGERTRIRIAVFLDGSAKWTVAQETDLKTAEDREIFDEYSKSTESNKVAMLTDFSKTIRSLVLRASDSTGRKMEASDFDLRVTVVGINLEVGVIEYSFLWTNFSKVTDRTMSIGDVFEGGFCLYKNDTLEVSYPQEFYLRATSPLFDSNRTNVVLWWGERNFDPGEPNVLLEDRRTSLTLFLSRTRLDVGEEINAAGQVSPAIGGVHITLTLKGPSGSEVITVNTLSDGSFRSSVAFKEAGQWVASASFQGSGAYLGSKSEDILVSVAANPLGSLSWSSPLALGLMILFTVALILGVYWVIKPRRKNVGEDLLKKTDFDVVTATLRDAGGAMLQSRIRATTGFSGAKLSRILKDMEKRGEVTRAKKGREQVVFLVDKR